MIEKRSKLKQHNRVDADVSLLRFTYNNFLSIFTYKDVKTKNFRSIRAKRARHC